MRFLCVRRFLYAYCHRCPICARAVVHSNIYDHQRQVLPLLPVKLGYRELRLHYIKDDPPFVEAASPSINPILTFPHPLPPIHQMRFSLPSLSIVSALIAATSAVDIQAWSGEQGCNFGTSTYFREVEHDTCIRFPLSFGVRFYGVPGGAQSHVYYDSFCKNFAEAGGAGVMYCLQAHNNMRSANWFYGSKRLVRRQEKRGETTAGVKYEGPDGTRRVLVSAGRFEEVLALVEGKKWDELALLPEGK